MTDPLVSIVIPAYNSAKYIRQCLQSVIEQTYPRWEALVVISPSEDDTFEIVKEFQDHRVKAIRERRRSNCATARNTGFNYSTGKYITFLDADDWWDVTRLEQMVSAMEHSPECAMITHYMIMHDGDKTYISNLHPGNSHGIEAINPFLFRRELLENLEQKWGHLFNENMVSADDADLVIRVREEPLILLTKPLYHYRCNQNGLTASTSQWRMFKIIIGIAIRNKCYDIIPFYIKDFTVTTFNKTFNCNIVRWKKSVFG